MAMLAHHFRTASCSRSNPKKHRSAFYADAPICTGIGLRAARYPLTSRVDLHMQSSRERHQLAPMPRNNVWAGDAWSKETRRASLLFLHPEHSRVASHVQEGIEDG